MVISDSFLASGPSGFCKPDVWDAWFYIAEKLSHVVKIFFFFRTFRLSMHFCLAINYKPTFTKVASILCSRRCKIWRYSRLKSWCPRFRDVSKTDFDVSLSYLRVVIIYMYHEPRFNGFLFLDYKETSKRHGTGASHNWVGLVSIRWSKSLLWGNGRRIIRDGPTCLTPMWPVFSITDSTSCMGWVGCFSTLLREVFTLRISQSLFSPKNQYLIYVFLVI